MEFGIFDHLDNDHLPIADFFEERMKLMELYDRLGFYSWHVAEHHATTLGMAPSPNIVLSAAAQRTKRLRFGPMVYALPLYHPMRLAEEIAMVDQMSRGRLDIGFGRGSSPVEICYFGIEPEDTEAIYRRDLPRILDALETGVMKAPELGELYREARLKVEPFQKPTPPVWYGVHTTSSADRAARNGWATINLDPIADVVDCNKVFRDVWRETQRGRPFPLMGLGRFAIVAETDAKANEIARRAYPHWHRGFTHLFKLMGRNMNHARPETWEGLVAQGRGFAGSPASMTDYLADQLGQAQCNYCVIQPAFGDQSMREMTTSIELFGAEVMPALCKLDLKLEAA